MNDALDHSSRNGFLKTLVFPALFVFLIPTASFFFFRHAEDCLDIDARDAIAKTVHKDEHLSPAERQASLASLRDWRLSELLRAGKVTADPRTEFHYATFRWLIWICELSILAGIGVFVTAGICVVLSRRSLPALYINLALGWRLLRLYAASQAFVQGTLLVALSFWITAIWFKVYFVHLITIVSVPAVCAAGAMAWAIFAPIPRDFAVRGRVIERARSTALWQHLNATCARIGTAPPDQLIAGIDDGFFVTETPVRVAGKLHFGRTLYVSLSLLKQLTKAETEAVLTHEMAHYSGEDTLYTKKIAPLLARYGLCSDALARGFVTLPIYYFVNCFGTMYGLSLSRHSRDREYRADRIAADATSPTDMAIALLKCTAYSKFRAEIMTDLFEQTEVITGASICERIEQGYRDYAAKFAGMTNVRDFKASHPFDSHPSLASRLEAIGVPVDAERLQMLVATPPDLHWYHEIDDAEQAEWQQWDELEREFRETHGSSLPFRLLPESEEERVIVAEAFPDVDFEGNQASLVLKCDSIYFTEWPAAVYFRETTNLFFQDGFIYVDFVRDGNQRHFFKLAYLGAQQSAAYDSIGRYYDRYRMALANRRQE